MSARRRPSRLTPLVDPPTSGGAVDARWERDRGVPVTASEARRRAAAREAAGRPGDAAYWADYAEEVESWGAR